MYGWDRLRPLLGGTSIAGWIVSGIGLVLLGLSLWYVIVVKAFYLTVTPLTPGFPLLLELIEIALLGGFSLVLVYAGYWLASSQFEQRRIWWAGLWTLIGLTGIVAIVTLVNSLQLVQGEPLSEPTLIQTMLLAAGGGAIAGLLIGVSTLRETVEAERARRQRNTLLFVNELLRHNVLNGMQVIMGNAHILEDHVDDEGEQLLTTTHDRAKSIVELIQNVRILVDSVSRETALRPVDLSSVLHSTLESIRNSYPEATIQADVPDAVTVEADDLINAVFENILANAVDHNDTDTPHVWLDVETTASTVRVSIADDGPGVPPERRETYFEPGEQHETSVGQGLGLYLVRTLVDRYGGDVWIEANEPRGAVVTVELPRAP